MKRSSLGVGADTAAIAQDLDAGSGCQSSRGDGGRKEREKNRASASRSRRHGFTTGGKKSRESRNKKKNIQRREEEGGRREEWAREKDGEEKESRPVKLDQCSFGGASRLKEKSRALEVEGKEPGHNVDRRED